ncbi:UdgX family uracil-DNA binding protein [Acidisphaera sp. L21]|uniref:UdgX family uracil-DNA binding protein n=1 Tax=Acidisphaera sp. L21 TaxID=1641851 RepID=UPI00131EC951|nr:UdgX family uracil-DNA binding protein [Acidisphaera sp. L21]
MSRSVILPHEVDWGGWRSAARALALEGVPPEDVVWSVRAPDDLFADASEEPAAAPPAGTFNVPRALVDLAQTVIQAREPARFALLYQLLWRAHAGERHLLEQVTDPDVQRANRLAQAVRRDTHKMRAFVRFREVAEPEGTRYVAWFEPDNYIVEANAAFFVRRFATMVWSILTPYRSAHWNGEELSFTAGAARADIPDDDRLEAYWRAYFSSIFNPARLKIGAMTSEMPRKYWRNLPEAAAIPELIRGAAARVSTMVEAPTISPAKPARIPDAAPPTLDHLPDTKLRRAAIEAASCRACPLWEPATQTVFGEGPADARLMFVGEQPGDQEDLAGRPFVGPAGKMFDTALAEAGIDRAAAYVTNSVKHFKFEPRGKRRIHAKPDAGDIAACKFWLDLEQQEVQPAVTVLLGATAARAVLGRVVTISRERSRPIALTGNRQALVTVHPSYLLRLPDEASRQREYAAFVADLRQAMTLLDSSAS